MSKEIKVFISHAWSYSEHYNKLAEWIFEKQWNVNKVPILFNDLSIPKNNPIHNAKNDTELKNAIFERIFNCDVVVIPMGMYANYSNWIQKEIDGSQIYSKPILAVDPWGAERVSSVVGEASDKKVGWNSKSVMNGIWELYNK